MKVTIQKTLNVPTPVRAHDTDAGKAGRRGVWDQCQADSNGTATAVIS
jgi:hypothetical protein|nr:MAG TPA: hypothetical protein [Caudoviricetes sp.]